MVTLSLSLAFFLLIVCVGYCIPIGLTACASFDDHITGGPGAPGIADQDSPNLAELSPGHTDLGSPSIAFNTDSSGTPNINLNSDPTSPNIHTEGGSSGGAFRRGDEFSGLSFNPDGTIDLGSVGLGAYNADVGIGINTSLTPNTSNSGPGTFSATTPSSASGFGSSNGGLGSTSTSSGVYTPSSTGDASLNAYSHTDMNPNARSPRPYLSPHPQHPQSPGQGQRQEDQPRPAPPRRGRGRAGNWKSESILRPTRDVVESEVRRRTFWHAYCGFFLRFLSVWLR